MAMPTKECTESGSAEQAVVFFLIVGTPLNISGTYLIAQNQEIQIRPTFDMEFKRLRACRSSLETEHF